jgi:ribosomal protein S18 acetylase RimI-like enzyme
VTRQAKPGDSGALVKILNQLSGVRLTENRAAANLAALRKARGGLQVAEFGALVGCIAWIVVPTLQRGPVGRITVLVVDERHRRQGLGTRLLAEAEVFLAKKGCQLVELMAASDNKSSHAFLRSTGFEQENYRFARKITS